MKNSISLYYGLPLLLLFFCCNNRTADSEKRAKEENDAMIDSQRLNQGPTEPATIAVSKSDADFLVEAASGGMLEIQLGHLVQERSTSEQVKSFSSMMIEDHGANGEKIKQLAASRNLTLPDSISSRQQKDKNTLQNEKDEFDRTYINMMISDHKKYIREFQKVAKRADDSEIKAYAADHLPTLYKHLDSAQQLLKRMGPKRIPVSAPPYQ